MRIFIALTLIALSITASADVIWDNLDSVVSRTTRDPSLVPALQIRNDTGSSIHLARVSFQGENTGDQMFKFFLADFEGNLISSTEVGLGATGEHALIGADVDWNLGAGSTYFIGASMASSRVYYDYGLSFPGTSQNGLTGLVNGNFDGYDNPAFLGTASAEMCWRLESTVPEPSAIIALAAGLGVLGIRHRRRSR